MLLCFFKLGKPNPEDAENRLQLNTLKVEIIEEPGNVNPSCFP